MGQIQKRRPGATGKSSETEVGLEELASHVPDADSMLKKLAKAKKTAAAESERIQVEERKKKERSESRGCGCFG